MQCLLYQEKCSVSYGTVRGSFAVDLAVKGFDLKHDTSRSVRFFFIPSGIDVQMHAMR